MSALPAVVSYTVPRPSAAVFEAIVDPERMAGYFVSASSGRMEAGASLTWTFADVGVDFAVDVREVEPERRVAFEWGASGQTSTVLIELEPDGPDKTRLTITESEFELTEVGVRRALGQVQGWTDFLCCMHAYLLLGVRLRDGRS